MFVLMRALTTTFDHEPAETIQTNYRKTVFLLVFLFISHIYWGTSPSCCLHLSLFLVSPPTCVFVNLPYFL